MERLNSLPENSSVQSALRHCRAQLSEFCNGELEPERAPNARYCHHCAPLVHRKQIKAGKERLRRNPRWRDKRNAYQRRWRAARKAGELGETQTNKKGEV